VDTPLSAETPEPVNTTTRLARRRLARSSSSVGGLYDDTGPLG
jgi:hypothetical protein